MRLFVPFSLIFLQIISTVVAFMARTTAPLRRPVTAAAAVAVLAEITPSDILTLVSNTDRGATASRALQDAVNMWIVDQAEAYRTNRSANASALDDPLLYGNFDVAFVATSKAQAQEGNPAGGRFRGRLGRFLYRNEGLYQHILRDVNGRTLAINYIRGKLFSRLPLSVILRGVATPLPPSERAALTAKYGTPLSAGTVRADFEPPLVTVGEIGLRVGPPSSVVLDTPYVDATVRLGVGSRGSTFLFKRTTDAQADGWKADLARRPLKARNLGVFMVALGALLATAVPQALARLASLAWLGRVLGPVGRAGGAVCRVAAVPTAMLGALLVVTKGGIIQENNDR